MVNKKSGRYLAGLVTSATVLFALIWAYVILVPGAFLESAYPIWSGSQFFLTHCNLGEAIISGDSRSEAAVDPRLLEIPTRNISFGAETPLEGFFFVRRALKCKIRPREVILTYAMPGFTSVSEFLWENGARFGYIDLHELNEVSDTASALGDPSVESVSNRLGVGGRMRNFLYAIHFPPLYFNALISGQIFRRYGDFLRIRSDTKNALGYVPYTHPAPTSPAGAFNLRPVQNAYFERTLALLERSNVRAIYIPIPLSKTYAQRADPTGTILFRSYLLGLAKRYRNFHIATPLEVAWPDDAFLDGVHLKSSNTARFTSRFNECQRKSLFATGMEFSCDLGW